MSYTSVQLGNTLMPIKIKNSRAAMDDVEFSRQLAYYQSAQLGRLHSSRPFPSRFESKHQGYSFSDKSARLISGSLDKQPFQHIPFRNR